MLELPALTILVSIHMCQHAAIAEYTTCRRLYDDRLQDNVVSSMGLYARAVTGFFDSS